jgi:hypothetical protein
LDIESLFDDWAKAAPELKAKSAASAISVTGRMTTVLLEEP